VGTSENVPTQLRHAQSSTNWFQMMMQQIGVVQNRVAFALKERGIYA
jgi:hypothetical protein